MANSHYIRLAYLERWGSMVVCRHGIVHVRWDNLTLRLEIEEFQRLAKLVNRAISAAPPFSFADSELSLTADYLIPGQEPTYRIGIDAVELLLSEDGWTAFQILVQDAAYRLGQVTARDDWQKEPEPISLALEAGDPVRTHSFSLN